MKKKYPILYLSTAEKDLEALFDFIRRDSPARAALFLGKVDRSILRLARFPYSGLVPRDRFLKQKNYRIVVVGDYLAFYRFERGAVRVYRVLHGKRRYEFLL